MKDTDPSEIRTNYLKLNRLVHPDKCHHPQAAEASAVVNSAKDTLTNPLKKRLYDAYVTDVMSGRAEAGAEMSYADWEAAQAQYPVKIPAWLEMVRVLSLSKPCFFCTAFLDFQLCSPVVMIVMIPHVTFGEESKYLHSIACFGPLLTSFLHLLQILRVPVVGQIFALILLIILLPLVLILIVLILVLWIICLPINIVMRCIFGPPPMDPEAAQANAAFAQAAHQPPPHATAQRGPGNV